MIIIKSYLNNINPFFGIIQKVLDETNEQYEKKFLSEMLLELNKEDVILYLFINYIDCYA